MPELPEVEAVRSSLAPLICGQKIVKAAVYHEGVIAPLSAEQFTSALEGQTITAVNRRGKYLLLSMEESPEESTGAEKRDGIVLMVHLRMTGQFVCELPEQPLKKHTHIVLSLGNGKEIRFTDVRRFGKMAVFPKDDFSSVRGLALLGPEPLSDDFSPAYFYAKIKEKKMKIKGALLDQEIVAGLGNIYADEVLFVAGILPTRICSSLSRKEVERLCRCIKSILAEAVLHKGTSFRDYVDGEGNKGGHQAFLQVYQRDGEPCYVCGRTIQRIKIAGRSSHYCSHCQK